ncbi:MAG: nucleotidyltransferase domain-containing protein [Lachnospiraceae bacterium]|nr:nucleotidyltransferase domain-containing protein [Lachnospiraceae bacterium]
MYTVESIKEAILPIGQMYGIKKIFLFGSYAKGIANDNSDIDLLIEKGKPLSLLKLSSFRQDVEDSLNLPVDVVTTSGIDEKFKNAIMGTEVLLYEE